MEFAVGERVSWTHCLVRGRVTMEMSLRSGVIVALSGRVAKIKKSSGRTEVVAIARLRKEGQKSQIQEVLEIMGGNPAPPQ